MCPISAALPGPAEGGWVRSRSNREDGSSHISHPGKDAAIHGATAEPTAPINSSTLRDSFMNIHRSLLLTKH